jgi:3-hydroxyacyl-[acyl-carrier-protein] dehydratase
MSRWTTLDRIVEMDKEKRARAIRNVPNTLAIFDSHFPRFHVLPGVLILGSLGELAARLMAERTGLAWRLARAETVRFRHFVQPGDQMMLIVELKEAKADGAVFSGQVKVDDKPVSTVRALRLVPRGPGAAR